MTIETPPLAPRMNHVFVDFENVHQVDPTVIGAKAVSFTLMVGSKQTKLATDLVEKLVEHASSVQLVRLKESGKNALDFALAYYLGRAVLADPTAYFHIIAKDGGYDPLINHLRERGVKVQRQESCAELDFTWPGKAAPVIKTPAKKTATKKKVKKKAAKKIATKKKKSVEEWTDLVVKNFRDHPKAWPAKRKTLLNKVGALIGEVAEGPEVRAVIARMEKAGKLNFDENDVPNYSLT